jgi:hypothetical protein
MEDLLLPMSLLLLLRCALPTAVAGSESKYNWPVLLDLDIYL